MFRGRKKPPEYKHISKLFDEALNKIGQILADEQMAAASVQNTLAKAITSVILNLCYCHLFASLGPYLTGMEACGAAHYWGRKLMALSHDVKPIPPAHVELFVNRQKNDKNNAAAIYEALFPPGLRFVRVRSINNQAMLMCYKAREILVQQRTQLCWWLVWASGRDRGDGSAGDPQHAQPGALIHEEHPSIPDAMWANMLPIAPHGCCTPPP